MATTNLDELLKTVGLLREEMHPELDQSFVEAVIRAEEQFPEDDAAALQAIKAALKAAIAAHKVS
jgi:hypothetical protein